MASRKRIRKKDMSNALLLLAAVLLVIAVGGFIISRWENKKYQVDNSSEVIDIDTVNYEPNVIEYNGDTYVQNRRIKTYLLMGTDRIENDISYTGGQADALMLVVINDNKKTWTLVQIDRDTMTEMDVIDVNGDAYRHITAQICLAHTYGTLQRGALNEVKTVSNYLLDQPVTGYYSMNMDKIADLNDAVGGVPVKITTDFTDIDPSLPLGEEVVLHGDQAMTFVRSRMNVDDGTNQARMRRQNAYLNSLINIIKGMSEEEIIDLYDMMTDDVITDMGSGDFYDIAELTREYERQQNPEIEGVHEVKDGYMTFTPDQDSFMKVILELFYDKQ